METRYHAFYRAIQLTNKLINSIGYLCDVRLRSTYFTREGKMGFVNLITFILNFTKKSLQIELDRFFKLLPAMDSGITKQAFSAARQKVSPKAFILLFQAIVQQFYTENNFATYRGYRLLAIDGTTLELQNTEGLRKAYGYAENTTVKVARARVSGLYDVENNLFMDAIIERYKVDEEDLAYRHIQKLQEYGLKNDLILFDRGYPSKKLIARLTAANIHFVMRVSPYFIREVNRVKSPDEIVEFHYKHQSYQVRVITFTLTSGIQEILVSSLADVNFSSDDFQELYFKRWGIETKYNEVKHKLQIENFTGDMPIAIEQDFYASMYLSNMAALAKMGSDEQIQERNQDKNLKYEHQTNTNILIGKLKDRLIFMILEPKPRKRKAILRQLMQEIARNTVPIRPGRANPRIKKTTRDRYPMNQKKGL